MDCGAGSGGGTGGLGGRGVLVVMSRMAWVLVSSWSMREFGVGCGSQNQVRSFGLVLDAVVVVFPERLSLP